jgi:hypothetical protein
MKIFPFILYLLILHPLKAGPLLDAFNQNQRPALEAFAKQNFEQVTGHIFYPFGGPDITYPLVLFPNLDSITLMGLESAELITDFPVTLNNAGLSNLSSLYKRSFFITDQMASGHINVTAMILKQIENLGGTEVNVSSAYVDRKNAVKITFTYNGKKRTVQFIKTSLDNKGIDIKLLKSLEPFDVVFFKAASYLPHQNNFSAFRKLILENARMIVQDSTGIPYKYLKDDFELNLHGQYLAPYKFPGGFEQQDYRCYSESLNKEKLSFCFGYGCRFVPTNILIASPKPKPML